MTRSILLLAAMLVRAALPAWAAEAPLYVQTTKTPQDAAALNEGLRALGDGQRRIDLTSGGTVAGTLTIDGTGNGITYPDGTSQTSAGPTLNSTNTWTAPQTVASTMTAIGYRITCPSAFQEVQRLGRALGCIQTAEEGTGTWANAADDCYDTYGGRLPTMAESCLALSNLTVDDETDDVEWVDGGDAGGVGIIHNASAALCTIGASGQGNSNAYRCWLDK